MIPVHSSVVFILLSGAKMKGKIVSDYFAVLAIFLPLIRFQCHSVPAFRIDCRVEKNTIKTSLFF